MAFQDKNSLGLNPLQIMRVVTMLKIQALFTAVVAAACLLAQPAGALTEEEKTAKLKALRETIEQVKQELDKVKNNRSDMLEALEQSEQRIQELRKKVDHLEGELGQKQTELHDLRRDKELLTQQKKQQTQAAAAHLNAAYRLGEQSSLRMLLNQQDPAGVSRNLKYFQYMVTARQEKVGVLLGTLSALAQVEPKIERTVAALAAQRQTLAHEQQALQSQRAERQKLLSQIEHTLASKDAELHNLEQNRSELQKVVSQIRQVVDKFTPAETGAPFASLKGALPWPAQGRVVRSYGSERVKGKLRWQGMLIGAAAGAPVRAVHTGRVVFADYLRGQGLLVIIDHGAGFMSLYAHNDALYTKLGAQVAAGEQIATVGASGGQTAAGLYFELRYKGEPTNPHQWLKRA